MKFLKYFIITGLLYALSIFSVNAVESADYGYGYMPGHMQGYNGYRGNLKVADLDLDGVNEIILLQGTTLTIMDNQGQILITKTVNVTGNYPWNNQKESVNDFRSGKNSHMGDGHYNGPHFGNPGYGDPDDGYPVDGPYFGSAMMGVSFEVANLDEDTNPEIIIQYASTLNVLDHNGEEKYTIELPQPHYILQ